MALPVSNAALMVSGILASFLWPMQVDKEVLVTAVVLMWQWDGSYGVAATKRANDGLLFWVVEVMVLC